jgi:hypothetical protein
MSTSTLSPQSHFEHDHEVWESLKQAIACSSGFKRWQLDQSLNDKLQDASLELQVRSYLRETLETLAY